MAEDRTPKVESQSGLIPCPPDDGQEHEPTEHPGEVKHRRKDPAAENRRRREPEIPLPGRPLL